MKKLTILIAFMLVCGMGYAQFESSLHTGSAGYTLGASDGLKFQKSLPATIITFGFVPKQEYRSVKASLAFNAGWLGFYTSIEKGTGSTIPNYFANIWGLILPLPFENWSDNVYLFGGIDLFGDYGAFNSDRRGGVRKEMGIGATPFFPWHVVKVGWSFNVNWTFETGIKFALPPVKQGNFQLFTKRYRESERERLDRERVEPRRPQEE